MMANISKYIEGNQIISIAGPTSSGKSAVALHLATVHATKHPTARIHLLSADSRQVYQGLEVLTGADIPQGWQRHQIPGLPYPSYQHPSQQIYLHGVSIIQATAEWSVAHFQALFLALRATLVPTDLLIVVGGTGFYQSQLLSPAPTIQYTPDHKLRQELEEATLTELQTRLQQLNPNKWDSMNHSDQCNPRRLIRAIELANTTSSIATNPTPITTSQQQTALWPTLFITIDANTLQQNISKRVHQRFAFAKQEVSNLLSESSLLSKSATSCTGFVQLTQLLAGQITTETCLAEWVRAEMQYAKRQHTWWKKRPNLIEIPFQAL